MSAAQDMPSTQAAPGPLGSSPQHHVPLKAYLHQVAAPRSRSPAADSVTESIESLTRNAPRSPVTQLSAAPSRYPGSVPSLHTAPETTGRPSACATRRDPLAEQTPPAAVEPNESPAASPSRPETIPPPAPPIHTLTAHASDPNGRRSRDVPSLPPSPRP